MTKKKTYPAFASAFEGLVVAGDKRHAGRINWFSCEHFFHTGLTPKEAADKYLASHKDGPEPAGRW